MRALSLALAFGLELAALAAFGLWGVYMGSTPATQVLLGVGVPLALAVFWGSFLAPRAALPVPFVLHWSLKLLVFAAAVGALFAARHQGWAVGLTGLVVLHRLLCWLMPPPDLERFGPAGSL